MSILKFIPKSLLLLFFMAPLFIACKDKEVINEQSSETVQEATLEQKKQMLNNVVPNNTSNSGDMAGLNPEHGQPGHRCDIAVGAPLNGSGAKPIVTPIQGNNLMQNKPAATPVEVADGLNPPHGQPGHRCDVKVGDPL
ncbi:hypothetical protein [Aequorivita ciconiae]|uniref:hypothetical protein n=1 Tax=Aequorivita ciconiae TaxID=2494375 RepID=UPI00196B72FE|nr:hypothetical protein [Aequorivita sp. H23M31]